MCDSGSYFDLETVRNYILSRGGKITNHELVKHFRAALTNPVNKEAARVQFKEIVNTIASITRNDEGEKHLVLKQKYMVSEGPSLDDESPPTYKPPPPPDDKSDILSIISSRDWSPSTPQKIDRVLSSSTPSTPQSLHQTSRRVPAEVYSVGSGSSSPATSRPSSSMRSSVSRESMSTPPPSSSLRSSVSRESVSSPPPSSSLRSSVSRESVSTPPTSHRSSASSVSTPPRDSGLPTPPLSPESPPPVPPRRKSSEKINNSYKETASESKENKRPKSFAGENEKVDGVEDSKISVRERLQKFNKLATESQLTETPFKPKKRFEKVNDKDEEDSVSVSSLQLDPKFREWLVKCSQGDYQPVAKMAAENPRLVKLKNTANGYTALHWAAKYGNQDLVKLIAGTYGANVNARTNGGYTALHIAMLYGHEDLYNLLVKVYGADASLRDWSGKKARHYLTNKDTSVSADTFRKLKARKKQSEHGFLRIGSLNVRVKKTTEAFSNFLGVGGDKLHKNWGSADDLPQDEDCKKMPPPKQGVVIKKRKSKRGTADFSNSGGGGSYTRTSDKPADTQDSDSDTAAGFGSQWQSTV